MTADRWRQIEELFHSARESSAGRGAALLAQADPEFFGPYSVESKFGEGGMGEVFAPSIGRL